MNLLLMQIAVLCSHLCGGIEIFQEDTIVRENMGVTFHKMDILDTAKSVYHQTFVIPMNREPLPNSSLYCDKSTAYKEDDGNFIERFCPALQHYNHRHFQLLKEIQNSQLNIDRLLRDDNDISKRSLFGFVGRFAKSLFGVSTEEDTNILVKQIEQLQATEENNQEYTNDVSNSLQSLIKKN